MVRWTREASTDHEQISQWWTGQPTANIGVRTGNVSGLVVLDVDGEEGQRTLTTWQAQYGDLPETPRQSTGRGFHYFFRHSGPHVRIPSRRIADGLDVKADSGCVVGPGSIHANGARYAWLEGFSLDDVELAEMPDWLLDLATRRPDRRPTRTSMLAGPVDQAGANRATRALAIAANEVANAVNGTRNERLNRAAYGLGRFVARREVADQLVRERLTAAAREVGLEDAEIQRTIESGLNAGIERTRCTPDLVVGSDVEIAGACLEVLHHCFGQVVFSRNKFWRYDATCWIRIPDEELSQVIRDFDGQAFSGNRQIKLNTSRMKSVREIMASMASRPDYFDETARGINCSSGFIQFDPSGVPSLVPHDPDHRCRHVLPGSWRDNQEVRWEGSLLDQLLSGCFEGDSDRSAKIDLLGEVAGCAALGHSTRLPAPKAVVLHGQTAGNGKSQILELIRGLLPREAVSAISPGSFGDPTFRVQLDCKNLNACDELGGTEAIASEQFKQIVTGEPLTARDLYRPAIEFRPIAQHVLATNSLPTFRGGVDGGVRRRLLVVPFNRTIPESERVVQIGRRVAAEEPDLLLDWAVRGASRLIRQGGFTEPESCQSALRDWFLGVDPVLAWLESDQVSIGETDGPTLRTREAHNAFQRWAVSEGFSSRALPAINAFTQRVVGAGYGIDRRRFAAGPHFVGLTLTPQLGHWARQPCT
jgi:P4 family phage/plasmid primase-like protien